MNYAVIGNNFGDEGKGLAVDHLTLRRHALVVRHNGGAQAAHTVERDEGRFVFHELSSGSFNGADTYWAGTFYPDLYKLEEEAEDFRALSGRKVKIHASPDAAVTLLYDVFLNQKKEELRGDGKYGSCGMGIWEATRRSGYGKDNEFAVTIGDLIGSSAGDIAILMKKIEVEYMPLRYEKYGISEPLTLERERYADIMARAADKYVTLAEREAKLLQGYEDVVFEGGQGLLLDNAREDLWPHTTCSRTNLSNPVSIMESNGMCIDEAVYVTRTYLTRHGAGPFKEDPDLMFEDLTNMPNPWQDKIRFGRHKSAEELITRAVDDARDNVPYDVVTSLFVTHLNETDKHILTCDDGDVSLNDFTKLAKEFGIGRLYLSGHRNAEYTTVKDI